MRKQIFTTELYTGSQHTTPIFLNDPKQVFGVSQYSSDGIVVPSGMIPASTLLSRPRK
jgi:hypothetical protein